MYAFICVLIPDSPKYFHASTGIPTIPAAFPFSIIISTFNLIHPGSTPSSGNPPEFQLALYFFASFRGHPLHIRKFILRYHPPILKVTNWFEEGVNDCQTKLTYVTVLFRRRRPFLTHSCPSVPYQSSLCSSTPI